jgi:hypothetical protein
MSCKKNIRPVRGSGGGGLYLVGASVVRPGQNQPVRVFRFFLEEAESLDKPYMVFHRMLKAGNVKHIRPPEAERLDKHNAFLSAGPGVKGICINAVWNNINPAFFNPRYINQLLLNPVGNRDNAVKPP